MIRKQRGLRKSKDCECLYINLEFRSQAPAALVAVTSLMRSTALPGGEGMSHFIDEDITFSQRMLQ